MTRSWLGLQLVLLSCALLLAVVAVEGRHGKEESSSEEECHCEKRHCCMEECCEKRCHHECCCEKRHHHKDEECCKKKHSHGKEDAGKNKAPHDGKKHSRKRHPFSEESEEVTADSSESYKLFAKEDQERITELAAQTSHALPPYWREQAISHFNQGSKGTYYKHLEDGQLEYKKAIGVMVHVRMLLAETNCTKIKEQEEAGVKYSRANLEKEGCQLLPQLEHEKYNCTFNIFLDMRTEKKAVISKDCTIPWIKQLSEA